MPIVRLSRLADSDLDSIRNSIFADSRSAADSTLGELDTLELLAKNSGIDQQRDDLRPRLRLFSVRPYVIMYEIAADGIHVVRIVHGARDFPSLFSHDT